MTLIEEYRDVGYERSRAHVQAVAQSLGMFLGILQAPEQFRIVHVL
jgi:hypothetical protein